MKKLSLCLCTIGIILITIGCFSYFNSLIPNNDNQKKDWTIVKGDIFDTSTKEMYNVSTFISKFFYGNNNQKYLFLVPDDVDLTNINDINVIYTANNITIDHEDVSFSIDDEIEMIYHQYSSSSKIYILEKQVTDNISGVRVTIENSLNKTFNDKLILYYKDVDTYYNIVYNLQNKVFSSSFIDKVSNNFQVLPNDINECSNNGNNIICTFDLSDEKKFNQKISLTLNQGKYLNDSVIKRFEEEFRRFDEELNLVDSIVVRLYYNYYGNYLDDIDNSIATTCNWQEWKNANIKKYVLNDNRSLYLLEINSSLGLLIDVSSSGDLFDTIAEDFLNVKLS